MLDACHWWKNFTVVYRKVVQSTYIELEDYILEHHGGVYNGGASWHIDFDEKEDAAAFVLRYS